MSVGAYKKQSLLGGWTRVDLLLQLYERAITSVQACAEASADADESTYATHFIDAQKAMLAIHSGLKPEEHDVAFNVARLLHFALMAIERQDFKSALKVLKDLRESFETVADEVNDLERRGIIPAIPEDDNYLI